MGHPKIPGLPRGWDVVRFHQSVLHPRDAVVMCFREAEMGMIPDSDEWVVWSVNMIEGGCHNGLYTREQNRARLEFSERSARMN